MTTFVTIALLALVAYAVVRFAQRKNTQGVSTGNGSDAFAKLQSAKGKISALKDSTAVTKAEALAQHAELDELHSLLG
jgi:hypothetical protein